MSARPIGRAVAVLLTTLAVSAPGAAQQPVGAPPEQDGVSPAEPTSSPLA